MAILQSFLLGLLVVLGSLVLFEPTMACDETVPSSFNRSTFPEGFIFGASSSAYQYEGAANKYGRGPSIWDIFTHETPARTLDGSNGDVAVDFYHRYEKDVKLLEKMNMDALRFSISWSRILPHGKRSAGVNKHGIKFYNNLINELLSKGLQPFVTLFHWDLPQALEHEYNGFLSPRIVDDFKDFVDLCFEEFGDRVKHWITLNEPLEFSSSGYDSGSSAPGRCSKWVNKRCQAGNSTTEPYVVSHHMLLAHAEAVKVYKKKYQKSQKGKIGIVLNTAWLEPYSNTTADQEAAKRGLDFTFGWFMNPLTYGHYPQIMRTIVGDRLPEFTPKQSRMIKGSIDFLGLNYYTSSYATNESVDPKHVRYQTDSHVNTTSVNSNGHLIGPAAGSNWLHIYPKGIRYILNYTKDTYNNPTIYITENGVDEINNCTLPIKEALKDPIRIDYHRSHLWNVHKSMREYGVDVKGYFVWSLLDDFELSSGYTVRFGLHYIDYDSCLKRYAEFKNCLKRYPKNSVKWFEKFLEKSTYFHDRSRWNRSVGSFNTTWSEQELFDDDM